MGVEFLSRVLNCPTFIPNIEMDLSCVPSAFLSYAPIHIQGCTEPFSRGLQPEPEMAQESTRAYFKASFRVDLVAYSFSKIGSHFKKRQPLTRKTE